jgi:hypothetical protein
MDGFTGMATGDGPALWKYTATITTETPRTTPRTSQEMERTLIRIKMRSPRI